MGHRASSAEALDWVLAKLSAASGPVAPTVFKPPAFKASLKPFSPPPAPVVKPVAPPAKPQEDLAKTREKELALWYSWKAAPKHKKGELLEQLAKSQEKIINRHLARFPGTEVSRAAMKADLYRHYKTQLEKYDPAKGTSLATWVNWGFKGLKRFHVKHQNIVRITEPLSERIGSYRTAQRELNDRLGYAPTIQQIVEHTHSPKWSGKALSERDVIDVRKLVRKGFDIGGGGDEVEGAGIRTNDPALHAAHIIFHDLKPHEQKVHEVMFPRDGAAPVYKSGAIANRLGWEVSKVSKAKRVILKMMKERMPE